MKDLPIKKIVEFRRGSERVKRTFVFKLDQKENNNNIRNYWVFCTSAVVHFFEEKDKRYLLEKRNEVSEKYNATDKPRTKEMYKKNIEVLQKSEKLNVNKWYPSGDVKVFKRTEKILSYKGISLKIAPDRLFSFQKDGESHIGAIWFIAKKNGFQKEELGMFAEAIFRYLQFYFSEKYVVDPAYCIAVDLFNSYDLNYSALESGKVKSVLDSTVNDLKKLMK